MVEYYALLPKTDPSMMVKHYLFERRRKTVYGPSPPDGDHVAFPSICFWINWAALDPAPKRRPNMVKSPPMIALQ